MPEVIYCHQCAEDNYPSQKFCFECGSPLRLSMGKSKHTKPCRHCNEANESYAKFCIRCGNALIKNAPKRVDPSIPLVLNNSNVAGGNTCPGCQRTAALVIEIINQQRAERDANTVISYDGLVLGQIGNARGLNRQLLSPRKKPILNLGCGALIGLSALGCVILTNGWVYLNQLVRTNPEAWKAIQSPLSYFLVAILILLFVGYRVINGRRAARWDAAQSRWRRARLCTRCNAVFISGETLYTSPKHFEKILWSDRA